MQRVLKTALDPASPVRSQGDVKKLVAKDDDLLKLWEQIEVTLYFINLIFFSLKKKFLKIIRKLSRIPCLLEQ